MLFPVKVNVPEPVFVIEPAPENTPDAVPSEPWFIVNDFDPRDTVPEPV